MKRNLFLTGFCALSVATAGFSDVKVGNPMAVTGPIPELVKPMTAAIDLAVDHVNSQGGFFSGGEKYEVVRVDTGCDAVGGVDAVTKLINVELVTAIVGPVCSGVAIAQAQSVTIPAGVVTLSVSASSEAITNMESNTDLVFRTAASDAYQGVTLAELAISKGITDIAVSFANDDYNAAIAAVFVEAYKGMGGKITGNEAHEPAKASYRSEVATLGAGSNNLALFAYYGSSGITIMRNALETSAFSSFIGADGMLAQEVIDQIGAENLKNVTFTTSASDSSTDAFKAWKKLADAAAIPASDPFVPNSYDAAFLMALAIEKVGSADRSAIATALREVANGPGEKILPGEWKKAKEILAAGGSINYSGAAGPHDFDKNGDVAGLFSKNTVVDGKWKAVVIK